MRPDVAPRRGLLGIRFSGFLIVEKIVSGDKKRLTIHSLKKGDGHSHRPLLTADLSLLKDIDGNVPPAQVILSPDGRQIGIWEHKWNGSIAEANETGTVDFSEANDGEDCCPKNGNWDSLYWLAHLRSLTGADQLKGDRHGTFKLTDGLAKCVMPWNEDGRTKKWPFKDRETEVATKTLSDGLQYWRDLKNNEITIKLGSTGSLTFVDNGEGVRLTISNFPTKAHEDHLEDFKDYYEFVKHSTTAIKEPTPQTGVPCDFRVEVRQIQPIYCPPAMF